MTNLETKLGVTQVDSDMLQAINKATEGEGWVIAEALGTDRGDEFRIERLDEEATCSDDAEAVRLVVRKALQGSEPHKNALIFMYKYGSKEELQYILRAIADEK